MNFFERTCVLHTYILTHTTSGFASALVTSSVTWRVKTHLRRLKLYISRG